MTEKINEPLPLGLEEGTQLAALYLWLLERVNARGHLEKFDSEHAKQAAADLGIANTTNVNRNMRILAEKGVILYEPGKSRESGHFVTITNSRYFNRVRMAEALAATQKLNSNRRSHYVEEVQRKLSILAAGL